MSSLTNNNLRTSLPPLAHSPHGPYHPTTEPTVPSSIGVDLLSMSFARLNPSLNSDSLVESDPSTRSVDANTSATSALEGTSFNLPNPHQSNVALGARAPAHIQPAQRREIVRREGEYNRNRRRQRIEEGQVLTAHNLRIKKINEAAKLRWEQRRQRELAGSSEIPSLSFNDTRGSNLSDPLDMAMKRLDLTSTRELQQGAGESSSQATGAAAGITAGPSNTGLTGANQNTLPRPAVNPIVQPRPIRYQHHRHHRVVTAGSQTPTPSLHYSSTETTLILRRVARQIQMIPGSVERFTPDTPTSTPPSTPLAFEDQPPLLAESINDDWSVPELDESSPLRRQGESREELEHGVEIYMPEWRIIITSIKWNSKFWAHVGQSSVVLVLILTEDR